MNFHLVQINSRRKGKHFIFSTEDMIEFVKNKTDIDGGMLEMLKCYKNHKFQ